MLCARDAGHVTKNFPRAIKVPIYQTTGITTCSRRKPSANGERRRSELGVVRVRERVELPGGPRAGSQNV